MTTCSHAHCHRPAVMAVQTLGDPCRSIVFYDLQGIPIGAAGADRLCRLHGIALTVALIQTIVPEPETHPDHLPH